MFNIKQFLSYWQLGLLLILSLFFEVWYLPSFQLNEFDEGRFTANAFEMLHNGDYINLHYMFEPDEWVARPPLKAWLIIAGYKLIGYSIWGARLSSICAILLYMTYCFRLASLFFTKNWSLFVCLMLIGCKGIFGFHVGRSADMDAELIFFLTAFLYHFVRYLFYDDKKQVFYWGLFLGLSFLLKTTASLFYLPGVFLFLVWSKQLKKVLTDKNFWMGAGVFVTCIISWFTIVMVFGATYKQGTYAGDNAWETMIIYDTWMRFTSSNFDGHPVEKDWAFFVHALDSRFNIWNYFAYAGILFWAYIVSAKKKIVNLKSNFLVFCFCVLIPPALLLTFGMHKLDWYAAPTLFLLAIFAVYFVENVATKWKWFTYLVSATLVFALVRQLEYLKNNGINETQIELLIRNETLLKEKPIYFDKSTPSNVYTWLCWNYQEAKMIKTDYSKMQKGSLLIGQKNPNEQLADNLKKIDGFVTSSTSETFIAEVK
jgi:4-amino-4-deoxy-L-arabinose transferase-like glycosyltransferase